MTEGKAGAGSTAAVWRGRQCITPDKIECYRRLADHFLIPDRLILDGFDQQQSRFPTTQGRRWQTIHTLITQASPTPVLARTVVQRSGEMRQWGPGPPAGPAPIDQHVDDYITRARLGGATRELDTNVQKLKTNDR